MDIAEMILFGSNMDHPLNQLSWNCQKDIIAVTMHQFREFPLCGGGYDAEGLRFYEEVLGSLIRMRARTLYRRQNLDRIIASNGPMIEPRIDAPEPLFVTELDHDGETVDEFLEPRYGVTINALTGEIL